MVLSDVYNVLKNIFIFSYSMYNVYKNKEGASGITELTVYPWLILLVSGHMQGLE